MSNMVPPTPGRGLSNVDFRNLLNTPRREEDKGFQFKVASKKRTAEAEAKHTPKKTDTKRKKPKPKGEEDDEAGGSKYRDRARERREGVNPDYEGMEHLEIMNAITHEDEPSTAESGGLFQNKLSVDKTKYLGGDVDHTHLVRGLDTVLLTKVKSEKQKEAEQLLKKKEEAENEKKKTVEFASPIGRSVYLAVMDRSLKKNTDLFLLGRTTYIMNIEDEGIEYQDIPRTLCRSKEDCPNIEEKVNAQVNPALMSEISKIMSNLYGTKGYKKGKKKELQNEPTKVQPKAVTIKVEDDDEKIFSDAEDYIPNDEKKVTSAAKASPYFDTPAPKPEVSDDTEMIRKIRQMAKMSGAFNGEEDENTGTQPPEGPSAPENAEDTYDVPRPPPSDAYADYYGQYTAPYPPPPSDGSEYYGYPPMPTEMRLPPPIPTQQSARLRQGQTAVEQMGEKATAIKSKDKREQDPSFVSDSYTECYPGAFEPMSFNSLDYDSEEDDRSKMDLGKQAKKMKRTDFETEEEWTEYNYSREAMPKAAFQFGVKMSDGRKTRKSKEDIGKSTKDKSKIDKEMNQINQMINKWKGDGGSGKPKIADSED